MALPCSNEQVKKAFVFSCFTGLRLSDARTLTWRKVYKTPDGKTLYIHVFMQKTQKPNNIPLSQEALNCLQPPHLRHHDADSRSGHIHDEQVAWSCQCDDNSHLCQNRGQEES